MKAFLLFASLFLCFNIVNSQVTTTTLNSSGGSAKTSSIHLEWSIGELTAIQTLTSPLCTLTQGLLQPGDIAALPVELLNFDGQLVEGKVQLVWQTSKEENTHTFEIQRSSDGVNFLKIGSVIAAGNSNTLRDYNFYDLQPLTGKNFYRLKTIDIDAKFKLSPVVSILNQTSASVIVFPNPVNEFAQIKVSAGFQSTRAQLLDATGKLVKMISISYSGSTELNMSGLARGIYYLSVETKNGKIIKKVIRN